jgi:trehalose 6-phosphate synthase
MRTTLKMVVPLIVSVAAGCLLFAAYQVHTQRRILRNDLSHRAETLGVSLQESVEPLLDRRSDGSIQPLIERFSQREHLKGIAVFDISGASIAATPGLPPQLQSQPAAAIQAASRGLGYGEFVRINQEALHIYADRKSVV